MSRFVTLVLVVGLAACGNKKQNDSPAAGSGSGSAVAAGSGSADGSGSATGSGTAQAAAEPVDVPTEVDFEDSAQTDITDKNLEARVKDLEAELGDQ